MSATIHRLHLANVNLKGQFNPPTYVDARIDVLAYAVIRDTHVILMDTGVGLGNSYIERTFEPTRKPIVDELKRIGLSPGDVTTVINSHLHFDHCGNNALFPHADVLVQERELIAARTNGYTVRDWFDYPDAKIRSVSGDHQIAAGVTLIATPGHTPGHQSLLLETGQGPVVVAAQAAFSADEYERGGEPAAQAHEGFEQHYTASIARLKSLGARQVYFSHDTRIAA